MYHRQLNISKSHSFFLFGARGTGKSELLKSKFSSKNSIYIDLLDPELCNELSAYPNRLLNLILPNLKKKEWVIIDEIQKIPSLLDIVHQQISAKNFKFALTGSSARKLKRGGVNLLAGRAFVFNLFPLTYQELGKDFNLDQALSIGTLPEVWNIKKAEDKIRFLKAYADTYLQEEIIAEQLIRNLPPFRRFLEVVGSNVTEMINYSNIAKDTATDAKTIMRYYEILEDTLLGFYLPSYDTSIRKQQKKSKKFYFFDNGIIRVLSRNINNKLIPKSFEYGQLFENFIVNEIYRLIKYQEKQYKLSFLRVSEKHEIDLIIDKGNDEVVLCEIKSSDNVNEQHAKTLNLLAASFKKPRLILISQDKTIKQFDRVEAMPWQKAITEILS